MFCENCGKLIPDESKFCPSCGSNVGLALEGEVPIQSTSDAAKPVNETKTFTLGLLSVVFSVLNYVGIPVVHLVGIVLGIIGLSLAKKDKDIFGAYSRPGKILSIIGLVLGAVAFLYGFIYVMLNPDAVA